MLNMSKYLSYCFLCLEYKQSWKEANFLLFEESLSGEPSSAKYRGTEKEMLVGL